VDVLCRRLGERRGRPIRLVPYALPVPGPFGLWLATAAADYIVFQSETTRMHQDHIVLHEIGHILADHHSRDTGLECWQAALPDLSPEAVRRALARGCHDSEQEHEAETVATIIMQWASEFDVSAPLQADTDATRRLEAAFGQHSGWL
jgi:Zn-dependent peptidase ImmA (M78 family)